MAVAVPSALVAMVPVSVAAWPGGTDQPHDLEPISILGEGQRSAPLGRSADRTAEALRTGSPTPTATTPTATPTPTQTAKTSTPTETPTPEPTVVDYMYVTAGLNMRAGPGQHTKVLTVLAYGTKVGVTGTKDAGWVQIIYDGQVAWVSGDYLSATEPPAQERGGGISYAECATGSAVEEGLTPDAIRVHRAVCAEFTDVTSYGGWRADDGPHGEGRALDIMVSTSALGDAIAAWVRDHYAELGVSEVIWAQHIWTVERSSEGWRLMEDRGSITANHYDHVHVTVYGDSGG